jgi:hypothetical protein
MGIIYVHLLVNLINPWIESKKYIAKLLNLKVKGSKSYRKNLQTCLRDAMGLLLKYILIFNWLLLCNTNLPRLSSIKLDYFLLIK